MPKCLGNNCAYYESLVNFQAIRNKRKSKPGMRKRKEKKKEKKTPTTKYRTKFTKRQRAREGDSNRILIEKEKWMTENTKKKIACLDAMVLNKFSNKILTEFPMDATQLRGTKMWWKWSHDDGNGVDGCQRNLDRYCQDSDRRWDGDEKGGPNEKSNDEVLNKRTSNYIH